MERYGMFLLWNPNEVPAANQVVAEVYGHVKSGSLAGVPIAGCLGDQQAALVGHCCFEKGSLKNTYGTGSFMLCNTGDEPVASTHGLLTTVGYQLGPDATPAYALEGSIAIAGAAVKWLRDNLEMIETSSQISEFAARVENTGGAYFVPALSGLFAPHWRDDARGTFVGMTQYTTREHLCRAALEAVCFQTRDIMDAMTADSGYTIRHLAVDGGLTNADIAMQIQANIANADVIRPAMREVTALGSALAAGHAVGTVDITTFNLGAKEDVFKPNMSEELRSEMRLGWTKAVEKACGWEE
jgi:glycerol kinase